MTRTQRKLLGGGLQVVGSVIAFLALGYLTIAVSVALAERHKAIELVITFGSIVVAFAISAVMIVTGAAIFEKSLRNTCPRCEYDLRGQLEPGCPECGWRRYES